MSSAFEKFTSGSPVVLLDFSAEWCEPCKWVVPILNDVEKHFGEKIKIVKIDIDEFPDLAKSISILSVPTLILVINQQEVWRMRGFDSPPALIKTLSNYIK